MTYKRIETLAYHLHFIQTKRFKKTVVQVDFRSKFKKEDITYANLLFSVLQESTKKYPTFRKMNLKTEDLYNIAIEDRKGFMGSYLISSLCLTYLNDEYTEPGNGYDAIRFLHEILFSPNVIDGKFDSSSFRKCKDALKEQIILAHENPNYLARKGFLESMFPGSQMQYIYPGYLEDLEKIDEYRLYEYYQNFIKSNTIDIFVCGDVDCEKMTQVIKENFPVNTMKKPLGDVIYTHPKFRKRMRICSDQVDHLQQSILMVGAKIEDMTDFERDYVSKLYSYILGGGSDSLLFTEAREKHSLCYYINSSVASASQMLTIRAGIDQKNYKKTLQVIKKQIKRVSNGDFDEKQIENFKMIFRTARLEMMDSAYSLIQFYRLHEYLGTDLKEESLEKMEQLTKEMVMDFAWKVHLDTVYFLEGGNRDE